MAKRSVVHHTGYGQAKHMVVADGAAATLIAIGNDRQLPENGWDVLDDYDAIIMGNPTYMGTVNWQFKKFADASSKPWPTQQCHGNVLWHARCRSDPQIQSLT